MAEHTQFYFARLGHFQKLIAPQKMFVLESYWELSDKNELRTRATLLRNASKAHLLTPNSEKAILNFRLYFISYQHGMSLVTGRLCGSRGCTGAAGSSGEQQRSSTGAAAEQQNVCNSCRIHVNIRHAQTGFWAKPKPDSGQSPVSACLCVT